MDGHALKLRFTEHKRRDTVGKGSEKASTKLHVKNVAFEATEKELRQLFSPFGQVTMQLLKFWSDACFSLRLFSLQQTTLVHVSFC